MIARLAKRWVLGMMMSDAIADEAVELLVAHCFCEPGTARPPASHVAGLLRFLQLLAGHAWEHVPLLVDPHKELTAAQSAKIHDIFEVFERSARTAIDVPFHCRGFVFAFGADTVVSDAGRQPEGLEAPVVACLPCSLQHLLILRP